jgi:5-methylcytosine-specific restriction enzyme A
MAPLAPHHPCNEPGCPALVPRGVSRCPTHQRQRQAEYNRTQRPARHQFYNTKEWRALSKQVLQEGPNCRDCGAPSTQADHILSVKERPDLALVRSNVTGRCGTCHSRRTAREHQRWG